MVGDPMGAGEQFTAEQIRHLVDTAVNPFVIIDGSGTALWASATVDEVLGVPAAALVGRNMLELVAPSSQDAAAEALAAAVDDMRRPGDAPAAWEGVGPVIEMQRADGTTVSCAIAVATPARTGMEHFVLQLRRADAPHALEKALRAMGDNRPLDEVLGHVADVLRGELPDADVVILLDADTDPIPVTGDRADWQPLITHLPTTDEWKMALTDPGRVTVAAAADLPPVLRERAVGRGYRWLSVLATTAVEAEGTAMAAVSVWSRADFPMHFLNHERMERCGSLTSMALRWEHGRRALEWAATHDGLTGLPNRSAFLTRLRAIGSERRRATDAATVLYLDLDDFKPINDDHGHAHGDRVLVEVAARLGHAVRPTDIVARLGGDEFAVLCPGLSDLAVVEALAERLVAAISQPFVIDGITVSIGLSVGIATQGDEDVPDRLLSRADTALRAAKREGKARWQVA